MKSKLFQLNLLKKVLHITAKQFIKILVILTNFKIGQLDNIVNKFHDFLVIISVLLVIERYFTSKN